jgi:ribosomal protein S18 acetylase RimI-like enzyme
LGTRVTSVEIRRATVHDLDDLAALRAGLEQELGGPEFVRESWEEARLEVEGNLRDDLVLVAEAGGQPAGYAEASFDARLGWLKAIYVRPELRGHGTGRELLRHVSAEARRRGLAYLGLEVPATNAAARTYYERLGFAAYQIAMAARLDDLDGLLGTRPPGPTYGSVYVQSDDEVAVTRAARLYVPRLGRSARTEVRPPWNGWTRIDDELCSRDPKLLRRLAQELSYRTGGVVLAIGVEAGAVVRYSLFDRGAVADEYASVPEHLGSLPPGDVIALSANPTVVHRLTGADPAEVRVVARNASSTGELPPAADLLHQLLAVLRVEPA